MELVWTWSCHHHVFRDCWSAAPIFFKLLPEVFIQAAQPCGRGHLHICCRHFLQSVWCVASLSSTAVHLFLVVRDLIWICDGKSDVSHVTLSLATSCVWSFSACCIFVSQGSCGRCFACCTPVRFRFRLHGRTPFTNISCVIVSHNAATDQG